MNIEKSELNPKQLFDFVCYQFDLSGLATDVFNRVIDSHRKASPLMPAPHESHTVALEKQLEGTGIPRKHDTRVTPPYWLQEGNVLQGQPLHPLSHALQIFTDASKEGLGTHSGEHTVRRTLSLPESKLYINFLEL